MADQVIDEIPRKYIKNLQGKDHVMYDGLLDLAHKKGLRGIDTEMLAAPSESNDQTAMFKATIAMLVDGEVRTFTGHGDANSRNVNKQIGLHAIRMAETRAKARALRDALNIKGAAWEELGGDAQPEEPDDEPAPKAKPADDAPITDDARQAIGKQIKRVGWAVAKALNWVNKHVPAEDETKVESAADLTMGQARALMTHLKGLPDTDAA